MQMAAAPPLGVTSYKPEAVNQVQPRGISMMVSGDTGVPYGTMMPQLATLQIGNSVSHRSDLLPKVATLSFRFPWLEADIHMVVVEYTCLYLLESLSIEKKEK